MMPMLKSTVISGFLILLLILLSLSCDRKTADQKSRAIKPPTELTGKITFLIGNSEVKREGSNTWIQADVGIILSGGDEIRTGNASTMDILLFENAAVRLKENTTVSLIQLITSAGDKRADMNLSAGRIYTFLKKMGIKGSYVNIRTPNAVAAIRGTRFMMEYSPEKTTRIKVLDGTLTVINRGNIDDQFSVADSQKVEIFHRGLRDSVTTLSGNDLQRLDEIALIHFATESEESQQKGTDNIVEALDIYKIYNGRFPQNLDELTEWGIIDKKFLKDEWDSDYIYIPGDNGTGYSLRSIGADHIHKTPDDIVMSR